MAAFDPIENLNGQVESIRHGLLMLLTDYLNITKHVKRPELIFLGLYNENLKDYHQQLEQTRFKEQQAAKKSKYSNYYGGHTRRKKQNKKPQKTRRK